MKTGRVSVCVFAGPPAALGAEAEFKMLLQVDHLRGPQKDAFESELVRQRRLVLGRYRGAHVSALHGYWRIASVVMLDAPSRAQRWQQDLNPRSCTGRTPAKCPASNFRARHGNSFRFAWHATSKSWQTLVSRGRSVGVAAKQTHTCCMCTKKLFVLFEQLPQ